MLIRRHDAALDEAEWRSFIQTHDFGQFVASGRDRDVPVIVPTHFVYDGEGTIILHLSRDNPVWAALSENNRAVMSVAGAYTYIPTDVNASEGEPSGYGVPTSYYGAVQAIGSCAWVEGEELASLLSAQLAHFQPEGGYGVVEPGDNPYGRQLRAIRGIRLTIEDVRAKFKFGNNKTVEHRLRISEWLSGSDRPNDQEALAHLLRRLEHASRPS